MEHDICDVAGLETTVGRQPLAAMMKSVAGLDAHCSAILAYSTAAVMVHRDPEGVIQARVVGGEAAFACPDGASRLAFDSGPSRPQVGSAAALLFLVPGWRESLRVNGRIDDTGLVVDEAFVHCGKAMIRSGLWSSPEATTAISSVAQTSQKGWPEATATTNSTATTTFPRRRVSVDP